MEKLDLFTVVYRFLDILAKWPTRKKNTPLSWGTIGGSTLSNIVSSSDGAVASSLCQSPTRRSYPKIEQGLWHFSNVPYADDATVFVNPTEQDLLVTDCILQIFGNAIGLVTNMQKTEFYPIRCEGQAWRSSHKMYDPVLVSLANTWAFHCKKGNHLVQQCNHRCRK